MCERGFGLPDRCQLRSEGRDNPHLFPTRQIFDYVKGRGFVIERCRTPFETDLERVGNPNVPAGRDSVTVLFTKHERNTLGNPHERMAILRAIYRLGIDPLAKPDNARVVEGRDNDAHIIYANGTNAVELMFRAFSGEMSMRLLCGEAADRRLAHLFGGRQAAAAGYRTDTPLADELDARPAVEAFLAAERACAEYWTTRASDP